MTVVTALLGAFTGFYTSYAGSKAPVEHFTRGVAKELADKKISVNCIAQGPMDTRKSIYTVRGARANEAQHSSIRRRRPRLWHSIRPRVWVAA